MLAAQSKWLSLVLARLDALNQPPHRLAQIHHFSVQPVDVELLHFSRQFGVNAEHAPSLRFTDSGQKLAALLDDVRQLFVETIL